MSAQQQAVGTMYQTLLTQANLMAYLDIFLMFAGIGLVCLVAALLLKKAKVRGPVNAH